MEQTVARIHTIAASVRRARETVLVRHSQAEIVDALVEVGRLWADRKYLPRIRAEAIDRPFPFSMTQHSLEGLIESLTRERLMDLLVKEHAWRRWGYPVIGHVIAGNTPLLSWSSIIRALLLRSASLVKLPANDRGSATEWTRLLKQSLNTVKPSLGDYVGLIEWGSSDIVGGSGQNAAARPLAALSGSAAPTASGRSDADLYRAFCESCDIVLAYGSDATIEQIRGYCGDKPLLGYGHRVSFGLILPSGDLAQSAEQLAHDILIYDQGGCLSPQTCFVVGPIERAERFAVDLARNLDRAVIRYPLYDRNPNAARRVRQARELAVMEGARMWADPGMRWTVLLREPSAFEASPTHGVISVVPLLHDALLEGVMQPVSKYLQGCAVAGDPTALIAMEKRLLRLGVSYICPPGKLQAPPIDWPQDNIPLLRSLLPTRDKQTDGQGPISAKFS